jgi:SAM-dependent MidA family methyltransferase
MDITPSTAEIAHSQQLAEKIHSEIKANNGQISFSKYMAMALYTPGLGYYASGTTKFGSKGDFTTAPELSPLFGKTIVQTLLPILESLESKGLPVQILEFGAGSGALAESILDALKDLNFKIDSYFILDLSADLIERQKERLSHRSEKLSWLSSLPSEFNGIILANEVIDAMPVEVITLCENQWHHLDVRQAKSQDEITFEFCIGDKVLDSLIPSHLDKTKLVDGYTTEIHPNALAWINSLAEHLNTGVILSFDYGFAGHEYYHPQRSKGTLIAHYRHHAIQDPFFYPGICDLTAHVDWSEIAKTAIANKLDLLGFTSQAAYLLNAGIAQLMLAQADPNDPQTYMPIANALQKLLSEAEMGELFKVICLGKNVEFSEGELPGFTGKLRAL